MNIQQIIELGQYRNHEAVRHAFARYIIDHNLTTKQAIDLGNQIKQALKPAVKHKTWSI